VNYPKLTIQYSGIGDEFILTTDSGNKTIGFRYMSKDKIQRVLKLYFKFSRLENLKEEKQHKSRTAA
jgi:Zn/Cd-binding protein ZinT